MSIKLHSFSLLCDIMTIMVSNILYVHHPGAQIFINFQVIFLFQDHLQNGALYYIQKQNNQLLCAFFP